MLNWLRSIWYRRLRSIDMDILWPQLCVKAENLDKAKAGFALHAFNDPAWLFLGEQEIFRLIDGLEYDAQQDGNAPSC